MGKQKNTTTGGHASGELRETAPSLFGRPSDGQALPFDDAPSEPQSNLPVIATLLRDRYAHGLPKDHRAHRGYVPLNWEVAVSSKLVSLVPLSTATARSTDLHPGWVPVRPQSSEHHRKPQGLFVLHARHVNGATGANSFPFAA